jgi:acetyl esterase/lipase
MTVQTQIVLEPAAQQVADAFSRPPFLYELDYPAARKVLDDAQAAPVDKPPIDEEWITVPSPVGDARVRIIKLQGTESILPAIVYMHGGGWVLGNAATHDRLVRELAVGANAALASWSTRTRPRRATRSPSSRATPPRNGSPVKAPPRAWIPVASRSLVNRWVVP